MRNSDPSSIPSTLRESAPNGRWQVSSATALLSELLGGFELEQTAARAPIPRAVAWARVSTHLQEEKGLSIPEQLREIRKYASKHSIEIVAQFQEAASAFRHETRRTEFRRMLATAMANPEVSLVLVHDSSRFSRDGVRAQALIDELRDVGVQVVSVSEPQVDAGTPMGVFVEAITFAKNEAYSREIGFHTRKGCRANIGTRDSQTGWCYKNGGDPVWGYRAVNLRRGERRLNEPIIKRIWLLDETVTAGRPLHEWVRHCLVNVAGQGAALRELCEFCDQASIPPRRRAGKWSQATWESLLSLSSLLQYSGNGVWGVHDSRHHKRPPIEWAISRNAHPAIITAEEARAIAAVRRDLSLRKLHGSYVATSSLHYLLSGGLFRCRRCGRSMVGFSSDRYTCRTRMLGDARGGCGRGTNVRGEPVESEVIAGLQALLLHLSERGVVRGLNQQLVAAWRQERAASSVQAGLAVSEETTGGDVPVGTDDGPASPPEWSHVPTVGRGGSGALRFADRPPRIDRKALAASGRLVRRVLRKGDPAASKRVLRSWVERVEFDPDELVVEVAYRIPEDVTCPTAAGTWCRAHSPALSALLMRRFAAAGRGR